MAHEIVVIGPSTAAHLIKRSGHEFVRSKNRRLYWATALEAVADKFAGAPVFLGHAAKATPKGAAARAAEAARAAPEVGPFPRWRRVRVAESTTRLIQAQGRVGKLGSSWWDNERRQIRAVLHLTEIWADRLREAKARMGWGFSLVGADRLECLHGNGWTSIMKIEAIRGLDLVRHAAAGGRFID